MFYLCGLILTFVSAVIDQFLQQPAKTMRDTRAAGKGILDTRVTPCAD
jgi:hypothetical protein